MILKIQLSENKLTIKQSEINKNMNVELLKDSEEEKLKMENKPCKLHRLILKLQLTDFVL